MVETRAQQQQQQQSAASAAVPRRQPFRVSRRVFHRCSVVCRCEDRPPPVDDVYNFCVRCWSLQHDQCQRDEPADDSNPRHCNVCQVEAAVSKHESRRQQVSEELQRLLQQRDELNEPDETQRAVVHQFFTVDLWTGYCYLPDENEENPTFVDKLTARKKVEKGRVVLVNPIPPSYWVTEMQNRFIEMVQNAGDKAAEFKTPRTVDSGPLYPNLLRDWRGLAMWMLHHGPYKGSQGIHKLGLLAEVLGFIEKGKSKYWEGVHDPSVEIAWAASRPKDTNDHE